MNEEPVSLLNILAIVAVITIGLGMVVWQIFRAEVKVKPDKKS